LFSGATLFVCVAGPGSRLYTSAVEPGDPFDYYLDPAGDDNNDGTLASPWSIGAINSKRATYAGSRVGLLPGTYTHSRVGGVATSLYSALVAKDGDLIPVLQVQGGASSAAKTYIGSSDAEGNYSARTALIDFTNPSGGAHATNNGCGIGQWTGGDVTQYGQWKLQGVKIRGGTFATVGHYHPTIHALEGVHIADCEIYDQVAPSSNDNPGGIWFQRGAEGATDADRCVVENNYVHDLTTTAGSVNPWGCAGIITFECYDIVIRQNTFARCYAIYGKDYYQYGLIERNYCDCGDFGSSTSNGTLPAIRGFIPDTGQTTTFRHNIILRGLMPYGGDALGIVGNMVIDGNTFFTPVDGAWGILARPTSTARIQITNNLHWWDGTVSTDPDTIAWLNTEIDDTMLTDCDYNVYRSTALFSPLLFTDSNRNYASWQGFGSYGFDANSQTLASTPFSTTPAEIDPATFAITGAAATASSTGGPVGAVNGSRQIGADWL
jgi:hypothetical protein